MKNIVIPNFFKRIGAAFMDASLFGAIFIILYLAVSPLVMNGVFHYYDITDQIYDYEVFSHLFVDDKNDALTEVKDFTDEINESNLSYSYIGNLYTDKRVDANYVISHIEYYYVHYLTGENIELPTNVTTKTYDVDKDHMRNPNFNEAITVNELSGLPKDIYTVNFVKEVIFENKDYLTINEEGHIVLVENADQDNIRSFISSKINETGNHLVNSTYFSKLSNKRNILNYANIFACYIPPFLFVYLLFPLIFKNGQTLGKLSLGLCLVNKEGYKVTRPQVLLRFICFFVEITLFTFILSIHWLYSLATLGVGIVALMIATLISKKNRSLHDFLAGTIVIDYKKSTFFKNANEEAMYIEDMNKHLEDYSSSPIVDSKVIQIGSKVIDENEPKESVDKE